MIRLNGKAGKLIARSAREARRLAARRAHAPGGAAPSAKLRPPRGWRELAERCEKVAEQITPARRRAEDHRPAGLDEPTPTPGRSARASCGKPTEFGNVDPDRRSDREHPPRRARADPARPPPRSAPRTRTPAARHRPPSLDGLGIRRARSRSTAASTRPRRRGPARPRTACSSPAASRPARARTEPPTRPLPRRHRGPHQPPQARLRPAPIPPQRPPRHPHLDRLGDPRLQPRHARHPHRLTASRAVRDHPPGHHPNSRRPRSPPGRGRSHSTAVYPGQVASPGSRARARAPSGTGRAHARPPNAPR